MGNNRRSMVFCLSMGDVFDNEVPDEWRWRLFQLIRETPWLDWLLLTKRIGNAHKMLPNDWPHAHSNVWLGVSVVNQAEYERDVPKLVATPARLRFLSIEPMLEQIDLHPEAPPTLKRMSEWYGKDGFDPTGSQPRMQRVSWLFPKVDWVIVGGESGNDARPMNPAWARTLRDQCAAAKCAFFFKQWGEWKPTGDTFVRLGKDKAGDFLDGRQHHEFPKVPA